MSNIDHWERTRSMRPAELKAARAEFGWTQEMLGEALGLTGDQIRKYSTAVHRIHPCAATLIRFYLAYPECRPKLSTVRKRGPLKGVPQVSQFPYHIGKIFVFGSNLAGRHGAGAALEALERYGALQGQGIGLAGWSYAIPTKDHRIQTLPLHRIANFVDSFLDFATIHGVFRFYVTPIGTGPAGYHHDQIAPMFRHAPDNCQLPAEWKDILA